MRDQDPRKHPAFPSFVSWMKARHDLTPFGWQQEQLIRHALGKQVVVNPARHSGKSVFKAMCDRWDAWAPAWTAALDAAQRIVVSDHGSNDSSYHRIEWLKGATNAD